jgi:hypothetical protein
MADYTRALIPDGVVAPSSLDDLAETANREHGMARLSGEWMVGHAIRAGEALIAAKELVAHGEWLPWLAANFAPSGRTARAYMRVAANWQSSANLEEASLVKALESVSGKPHVAHNSGENEWYTPAEYIEAARKVMGGIDLDPASSARANEIVQATKFYTKDDSGLTQPWFGRVWMNPPYSRDLLWPFCERLCDQYAEGHVDEAVVLVNNATETAAFQRMAELAAAACFPAGRIKYLNTDLVEAESPLQGQAFLYFASFRPQVEKFREVFTQFGFTVAM